MVVEVQNYLTRELFLRCVFDRNYKNEIKNLQISSTPAGDAPGGSNPASHPATPNPAMSVAETQASIRNLLQEGKFNEAFLMALNANNLMVVVATCEMVNIKIFEVEKEYMKKNINRELRYPID